MSAIIPAYNHGTSYIGATLASVQAQHYPHVEAIVVDGFFPVCCLIVRKPMLDELTAVRRTRQSRPGALQMPEQPEKANL